MKQYVDGRVLAIGDCAHAMSPQLGQGANMALVDAHVLNKCVGEVCKTGRVDWPEVFAQYSQTRQKHLKYYRQASRWLTPLFQSKLPLGFVRDSALFVARHTAIGRMHAATTLVGGRVSWLRMNQSAVTLAHWDGGCAPEKNQ
jgi:2-polyprenyl-6-methoxyphenol hydroxylase-like FAD-dependent oxidoreductase